MAVPGINEPISQYNEPGLTPTASYPKAGAGQEDSTVRGMRPDTMHPEYVKHHDEWVTCRDAVEGEWAIKGAGVKYLPQLEGQAMQDYHAYRMRASYYAATARTVEGLTGAVMRKPEVIKFPDSDVDLLKEIGNKGEDIGSMGGQGVEEVLTTGRLGLYVDAPAEDEEGVPFIAPYYAENIVNWRWGKDAEGRKVLTMVSLREVTTNPDPEDPFKAILGEQYRVLLLVVGEDKDPANAVYTVQVWVKNRREVNGKVETYFSKESEVTPKALGGRTFNYIPFVLIDPKGITGDVRKSPILDLVNVNLSHYRNSADMEHGLHFTALPTAWAAGFESHGATLRIGSQAAWVSDSPQARAGYLEFSGNGLHAIELRMEAKQKQMAVLGARLLEDQKRDAEAAETVKLRHQAEHSVLSNISRSVSSGFTVALRWVADWLNLNAPPEDVSVELNRDFNTVGLDAGMLNALMMQVQNGMLDWDTYFYNLQRGEILPDGTTKEDVKARIAEGPPMGLPAAGQGATLDAGGAGAGPSPLPKPKLSGGESSADVAG